MWILTSELSFTKLENYQDLLTMQEREQNLKNMQVFIVWWTEG